MKIAYLLMFLFLGETLAFGALCDAEEGKGDDRDGASVKLHDLLYGTGRIDGTDAEFEAILAAFKKSLSMPPARDLPRGAVKDYGLPPIRDCPSVIFCFSVPRLSQFGIRNITVASGYFRTNKKGQRTSFVPSPISASPASADFMIPIKEDDRYFQINMPLSLTNLIKEVTVSFVYRVECEEHDHRIQEIFDFSEDPKPPISFTFKKKRRAATLEGYVRNVAQIWLTLSSKEGGGLAITQEASIRTESTTIATNKNSSYKAKGGV